MYTLLISDDKIQVSTSTEIEKKTNENTLHVEKTTKSERVNKPFCFDQPHSFCSESYKKTQRNALAVLLLCTAEAVKVFVFVFGVTAASQAYVNSSFVTWKYFVQYLPNRHE